jgi:antitoxin PrlF
MTAAKMTTKGQITIPAIVRAGLKVASGDRIEFVEVGEGRYEIMAVNKKVTALKGIVKASRTVSIDEMNEAIMAKGAEF